MLCTFRRLCTPAEPERWEIALKSRNSAAWSMPSGSPAPSSATVNVMVPSLTTTETAMPVAVAEAYFTAFVRPLRRIWRSRAPSVMICAVSRGGCY